MTKYRVGWKDAQYQHDVRVQYRIEEVIRRSKIIEDLKSQITAEIRMLRAAAKEVETLTARRIKEAKEYAKDPS